MEDPDTEVQFEHQQTPAQLAIPDSLSHLNVPLSTYLASNPKYSHLIVSTLIFTDPRSPSSDPTPEILLIQRASTEQGYPDLWEIPGGSVESQDGTTLLAAVREAYEETGLQVTRFLRQVGGTAEFLIGDKIWAKICFEVEVAGTTLGPKNQDEYKPGAKKRDMKPKKQKQTDDLHSDPQHPEPDSSDDPSHIQDNDISIPVTLNPTEHQSHAWATLFDIQSNKYPLTTPALRDILLDAFAHKKEIQDEMDRTNLLLRKTLPAVLERGSGYPHLPPPTEEEQAKISARFRVMIGAKKREEGWGRWWCW